MVNLRSEDVFRFCLHTLFICITFTWFERSYKHIRTELSPRNRIIYLYITDVYGRQRTSCPDANSSDCARINGEENAFRLLIPSAFVLFFIFFIPRRFCFSFCFFVLFTIRKIKTSSREITRTIIYKTESAICYLFRIYIYVIRRSSVPPSPHST